MTFDPARATHDELLGVCWESHHPRSRSQQGLDTGDQYRSAIYTHSPEQEAAANTSKDRHETTGRFRQCIAIEIGPAPAFWEAEKYHQQYVEKKR